MSEFVEIQTPDGRKVRFPKGMSRAAMAEALNSLPPAPQAGKAPKPDPNWRDAPMPEGMVLNPATGQVEDMRSPVNPNIPTGTAVAAGIGAGQGLGLGTFDEVVAGGLAATGDSGYDYELERMREAERRAQENNPMAYYGGKVPGAVASSLSLGKLLGINPQGQTLMGTAARGAGIGAGEGAIWGFTEANGGLGNRVGGAGKGAMIGAGVGAAAPVAAAGAAKAFNVGRDLVEGGIDTAIGRANTGRANRAMIETLNKSGRSIDDVSDDVLRAAQEGQPEYRLMDALGTTGQRRASGIVRSGGDGAAEVAEFLQRRQLDAPDRMTGFIDDAFGTGGTTAAKTREGLNASRKATNNVNYDAARAAAGPVNLNDTIATIDTLVKRDPILGDSALRGTEIGRRLMGLRQSMANDGQQLIDFDTVLNLKEDLGRSIGALRSSGKEVPAELAQVYGALDTALEGSSDAYRAANTAALAGRKNIAAVDTGAEAYVRGRADDTVPAFQAMTPDEQAAARVGYGDKAIDAIQRNTAETANVAKPFNSTKRAAEADAMALDPRLFGARVGRENVMHETQRRALGGSMTADNLQDVANLGPLANIGRALRDVGNLQFGSAAVNVAAAVGPMATGMNEPTRALIAKALMSDNPRQALAGALRQQASSQGRRRIAEAMMRAIGREAIPQ